MERTINRGYSAQRSTGSVLDRALDLSRVNWEVVYFAVLMIAVIGSRLFDLGDRAFHHDESIHAYYSYQFFKGQPWPYDPAYHGPFLYTMVALSFLLFGVTDATARLMPALFGTVLIGMIWFMRPYIGRLGALGAATIVAASPSIMYYSRALRHDIFALVGTFMLFLAILGFMKTHQGKFLFLGSAGLAIAYASHELIFINVFIFAAFLGITWLWVRFRGVPGDKDGRADVDPVASAVVAIGDQKWALFGSIALFLIAYVVLFSNFMANPQGIVDGVTKGLTYWFSQQDVSRGDQPWYYYVLLLGPIYEPLAIFTSAGFLIAMLVKAVRGGAGVPADLPIEALTEETVRTSDNRGEAREFSPYASGTDAYGLGLPSAAVMSGLTIAFLGFWGFGALIAYSFAGEKMPWLTMQFALPFGILAGAAVGRLLGRTNWANIFRNNGVFVCLLVVALLFALQTFFANLGGAGGTDVQQQQSLLKAIVVGAFVVLMIGALVWLSQRIGRGGAIKTIVLTLIVVLFAYEVRSATLASFRNGDTPVELLVYVQSTPEIPIIAQTIDRLGRDMTAFSGRSVADVTGGNSMDIALDSDVEWPFDWYWRDQQKLDRYNVNSIGAIPPSAPVILAGTDVFNSTAFQSVVTGKYTMQQYKLNWWFPEDDYKNPGFVGTFFTDLINPANWSAASRAGKYLLYRDPGAALGARDLYVYIRNDLLARVGTAAGVSTTDTGATSNTTYGMFDLAPAGNGNGQFTLPRGAALAPDGSYYVVDTGNLRVEKFDSSGKYLLSFGSSGTDNGQFVGFTNDSGAASGTGPGGIVVDKSGNVYVADTWNHRIQKFDSTGKFLLTWGSFINLNDASSASDPDANSKFYGPRGLAVDSTGNIYVTDTGNKRVLVFDENGKFVRQLAQTPTAGQTTFDGPNQLNEPIGIAIDAQDNVYVADTNNHRIVKFDKTGAAVANWAVSGWQAGAYLEPFMAVGGDGNLYVTDPSAQTVYKYSPTGQLLGSKNSENNVSLVRPTGIIVDSSNNIYVVDTEKNGVVKLGTIQ